MNDGFKDPLVISYSLFDLNLDVLRYGKQSLSLGSRFLESLMKLEIYK